MKKKTILLITSRFPYPPIGGDKLKNFYLIKILSKHYNLNLVSLIDRETNHEDYEFCKKYCYRYKIFKKTKLQSLFSLCKRIFNNKPLQVNYYYFKDVQKYIDEEAINCDILINTLIRTSEYIINLGKLKFLDIVDSIALNYQYSQKNTKSVFWKLIYKYETFKLFEYEKTCIKKYNNTFFVNKQESEYWSKFGKTKWIANGVNEKLFTYNNNNNKYKNYIAFFGKMDYMPNVDAIDWFVSNVLNKLNENIKLIIIGINPIEKVRRLSSNKVIVTGFVHDPYEILNSCFACIAPMQTGGGIQNKILETMALGKITITTRLGATAIIGAEDKEHLFIEDDPENIAKLINKIFEDRDLFSNVANNAKEFIFKNYTWQKYEKKLIDMLGVETKAFEENN
jgi:glycosyltransferase involved in cell wall biosynthesis